MEKIDNLSPLAWAFMGDAIHTAYVRRKVLLKQKDKMNTYHNEAKKFCNAQAQANALERLQPLLTDEENEVVRKARNCHNKHTAKNCDEKTYKKATSFEALVGWLYLNEKMDRLKEILNASIKE